jgi:hypothetical protein
MKKVLFLRADRKGYASFEKFLVWAVISDS